MNSKKIVLGIVAAGVATALIAPNFIGQQAERNINETVSVVNSNPLYSLEIKSYQRGWFHSTAVLDLTVKMPVPNETGAQEMVEIESGEIDLDLQHGPVLTSYDGGIGLLSWQLKVNDDRLREGLSWSEDEALYQLVGSVGLTGNGHYRDRIADMTYDNPVNGVHVQLSGYQGEGHFDSEQFGYNGNSRSFVLTIADEVVQVSDITFNTEAQGTLADALNSQLLESEMALGIEKIEGRSEGTTDDAAEFSMTGFTLDAQSELAEQGDTLDLVFETAIEHITSANGDWNGLVFNSEVRRLDVEFMQAYQSMMNELYDQPAEVMQTQMQALFQRYAERVVAAQPQFAITELSGESPEGSFNSELTVELAELDELPKDYESANFWLTQMLANGYVNADKALVSSALKLQLKAALAQQMPNQDMESEQVRAMIQQQVDQVIGVYLQQGFITEEEDHYRSSFELKEGTLLLNGKPIPLA